MALLIAAARMAFWRGTADSLRPPLSTPTPTAAAAVETWLLEAQAGPGGYQTPILGH
jgi:CO dehydrogenase/acetyl-CoA synthase delta subunit